MTAHSPLGFSGAERWSNCPGSVALIASLPAGTKEADPEYRVAGTGAHAAAAWCLKNSADAWETAGQEFEGYRLSPEDMDAVQKYLNFARDRIGQLPGAAKASTIVLIEEPLSAPDISSYAFGTLDLGLVAGDMAEIVDYKHGEGIWVDVVRNKQLMGYAALLLAKFPFVKSFRLWIVQPRCPPANPRSWEIGADELRAWIRDELIPAMKRAGSGNKGLKAGPWCRFCKAKDALACSASLDTMRTLRSSEPIVDRVPDASLGDLYALIEPAKIAMKAVEAEVLKRRLAGRDVPNSKTVLKKTWRQWKPEAQEALLAALGRVCLTEPELKTPAVVEEISPLARDLVKQYAYSPDAGYTVAPLSDRRKAVSVQSSQEKFGNFLDKNEKIE